MKFPPYFHLIKIALRSQSDRRTEKAASKIADELRKKLKDVEISGPAPAPIARIRGYYRWNILLKGKNRSIMALSLRKALSKMRRPSGVLMAIDVDPMSM